MLKIKLVLFIFLFISPFGFTADGLVQVKSNHSVKQTTKNLIKVLEKKGMTVFGVINHKKGAEKAGKKLRPTTVVIFGNPKVGTLLMNCSQTAAIDLPQKALIYKDENDQVWYTYNNPSYIAQRHNIQGCDKVIAKITNALENFAKTATK